MKKITVIWLLVFAATVVRAQIPLSHNINNSSVDRFATPCGQDLDGDGAQDTIVETSWWRSYTPSDFGITNDVTVTDAFYVSASATISAASTSATIRLYTTDAPFPTGNLTEITSETVILSIGDSGIGRLVTLSNPFVVGPDDEVVVQFEIADSDVIDFAFNGMGANGGGQTAPSYWSSSACGFPDIVDLADVITTDNHIVLNLVVDEVLAVEESTILAESVSLYPNPTNAGITLDFSKNLGEVNVQIATISGQVVLDKNIEGGIGSTSLDTSKLSTGIYFANIITADANTVIKFIKN